METISFNGNIATPANGFNLAVDVRYEQDIATNETKIIAVQGYVKRNNSTYRPFNSTSNCVFTVKGINSDGSQTQIYTTTKHPSYNINSNSYKQVLDLSQNTEGFPITISHLNNGKKSIVITFSFNGKLDSYYPNGTISKTVELPTIARKSSVTCADGNIGSATTININRASSTFTHTLEYNFLGLTGTIATKTSSTSIGWTIPTSFYAKIPNANSGKGTITCNTYSGNTLIGTSTCTFNAFVVNSNPTISGTVEDTNTSAIQATGNKNKLIRYISNAKVVITATAKNSATISSVKVVNGSQTKTTATSTINAVDSGTFNLSCIDSRGLSASATVTKTLVEYIKPVITGVILNRPSTTSNTINASVQGLCFNETFGAKTNTFELKWRYKKSTETTWSSYTTVTATRTGNNYTFSGELGTDFSYTEAFNFEFVLSDYFTSNTYSTTVTRGLPIIDIGKDDVDVNGVLKENGKRVITSNGGTLSGQLNCQFINSTRGNEWNFVPSDSLATDMNVGYRSCNTSGKDTANALNVYKFRNGQKGWSNVQAKEIEAVAGLLKSTSNGNVVSIGSQNSSWCHIYNSANIPFYFNRIVYANNGHRLIGYKEIYSNNTGVTGTITLSESAANFNMLEIFYHGDTDTYSSVRIWSPNGKRVALDLSYINPDNHWIQGVNKSISGTSISTIHASETKISVSPPGVAKKDYIKITKVLGWY
jgi:hypothetical protein